MRIAIFTAVFAIFTVTGLYMSITSATPPT